MSKTVQELERAQIPQDAFTALQPGTAECQQEPGTGDSQYDGADCGHYGSWSLRGHEYDVEAARSTRGVAADAATWPNKFGHTIIVEECLNCDLLIPLLMMQRPIHERPRPKPRPSGQRLGLVDGEDTYKGEIEYDRTSQRVSG